MEVNSQQLCVSQLRFLLYSLLIKECFNEQSRVITLASSLLCSCLQNTLQTLETQTAHTWLSTKNVCWTSHVLSSVLRTQNSGICTSTDPFHKHSIPCTHLLPHFPAHPTQALDLHMKCWKYKWKRQRKGGKACRNQQRRWWKKSGSSYFQSFDLPTKIYWILCTASQPAYKIFKSTWNNLLNARQTTQEISSF